MQAEEGGKAPYQDPNSIQFSKTIFPAATQDLQHILSSQKSTITFKKASTLVNIHLPQTHSVYEIRPINHEGFNQFLIISRNQ